MKSQFLESASVFIRGMAMGAADVVPGVSGGTIAFITGIYARFIGSLNAIDLECLKLLCKLEFAAIWKRLDAGFLLTLMAGIITAIFSLAHGLDYLIDHYPILLWSVFFGLITASALSLLWQNFGIKFAPIALLLLGAGLMFMISSSSFIQLSPTLPFVYLAGVIAISAMLLPGLSGSFLLLLFGLYEPTLEAVKTFDLAYIASFGLGAVTGLIIFSKLIHWLLGHFYQCTLMFLIGLLFGSLYEIWPWRLVLETGGETDRGLPALPATLTDMGQDAMLYPALACMISALSFVLFIEYLARRFSHGNHQH